MEYWYKISYSDWVQLLSILGPDSELVRDFDNTFPDNPLCYDGENLYHYALGTAIDDDEWFELVEDYGVNLGDAWFGASINPIHTL